MSSADDVARAAYAAYAETLSDRVAWDDLHPATREAWLAATKVAQGWRPSRGSQLRGHGPVTMRAGSKGPKRERVHATLREGRLDWYRVENLAADSAAVHIYDEIGYFGTTAADFVRDLSALKVRELAVHINSPGGEVWDGVAIHNAIKRHPANVTVYIDGLAASAASFIAMAGDEIVIEPNAQMMIHDAMTLMVGNAAEMRETADMLDKTSDTIAAMYAGRASGDAEEWRERMRAETWYSGEEAVAAGLADRLAGEDESAPANRKVAAKFDLSVFRFAGREAARAQVEGVDEVTPDPANKEESAQVTEGASTVDDDGARHVDEDHVITFDPSELAGAFRQVRDAFSESAMAFDPETFKAAVLVAAMDAPEPYTPKPPANALESDALPTWDPSVFRLSLKEATL